MKDKTIEEMLRELSERDEATEKTASIESGEDMAVELLDALKSRVKEDETAGRILKQASAAGDMFAKQALETLQTQLITDVFAEKVASKIIEKLAVETSEETVTQYSEPTPEQNPMTSVEESSKKVDPKATAANKKEEALLDRETTVGASVEGGTGPVKSASLEELLEAVIEKLEKD